MSAVRRVAAWLQRTGLAGVALDWAEALAAAVDDPEVRPAGDAEPHYAMSPLVTVSRDRGLYVYHVADDQLGQGSSLGNARAWAETKGSGHMLNFFSIEAGTAVCGGLSLAYLLPFSDLSIVGAPSAAHAPAGHDRLARTLPSSRGTIHLHPAYQQHESVIGDGLHVLETFFLPRTGMDDPAAAQLAVSLANRSPHPLGITVVASLDLRGATPRDLVARFDARRGALLAHNAACPGWVRVFGGTAHPAGFWATTDEEGAYSPGHPLPNRATETGDLIGALQFDLLLLPGRRKKVRLILVFSPHGEGEALRVFDRARRQGHALRATIARYAAVIDTAAVEMPDTLLTQGVQWAKACLLRPVSLYPVGEGISNDPGRSTHLVGRDTAWYTHGCDLVIPDLACSLLRVFADHQREDGLIPEYIDGRTGQAEDHGFNINDNTTLFVMAVGHHVRATGHRGCLRAFYEPARRAGEAILRARDERGLIRCTAAGAGVAGICGWRNVLGNEQISGVVTEVNAEGHAALCALAELATLRGDAAAASQFRAAAARLRTAINRHLIDASTGLYVRNIDLDGRVFTQATIDLVFPLICGVADPETTRIVTARLAMPDFMTAGGIRSLPEQNPRYDPSFEDGLRGGVWPGATWWYAMSSAPTSPQTMAESLRASYAHYVADPRVYNTVPGQFSEWSDGQTLVNRGMRLSPWEAPRFLWAMIEGAVGLKIDRDAVALEPHLPPEWPWLRLHNLPCRGRRLSFFLARQADGLHVYTCDSLGGDLRQHRYDAELPDGVEAISTGISSTAFRRADEVLVCLGNSMDTPILAPILAHHALAAGRRYRVDRLTSLEDHWQELGTLGGADVQRMTTRLEPRGYALYRFRRRAG